MDVVAVVGLATSVDEEAPVLAADLGLTVYETAVMLRAPPPVIVLRTEERPRAIDVLGKLRARRHDAVALDLDLVVRSEAMFRPKTFRFAGGDFVGIGGGEEQRIPLADIFAMVRAIHMTHTEDVVTTTQRKVALASAALTGGLRTTKVTQTESKRIAEDREPVLYLFRGDGTPWLLRSTEMLYDGLAERMRVSKAENFEVLLQVLREQAPAATFDTRLLAHRSWATIPTSTTSKHTSSSSVASVDVMAHVVAAALGRAARPYR